LFRRGRLLRLSSICLAHLVLASAAYAVTYDPIVQTGLGTLSWPNPHHYKNFIASGEYCTSTHFVCERPDFEIQPASISDVPEFGDLPLADRLGRTASSTTRRSAAGQGGNSTSGDPISSSNNAGDSPTGSFNGGGVGRNTIAIDPVDPTPPNPPTPSPVPLPATAWLLIAAMSGLGVYRRSMPKLW
jgi:hypothetical protein